MNEELEATAENMAGEENPDAAKGGKKKWLILALIFLVLVGAGAGGFFFFFSGSEEVEAKAPVKPTVTDVIHFDPLVVNVVGTGSAHYARVALALGVFEAGPELESSPVLLPQIQDQLISTLSRKSYDELVQAEVKEALKQEILERIQQIVPADQGTILEVYYTEFVVQ